MNHHTDMWCSYSAYLGSGKQSCLSIASHLGTALVVVFFFWKNTTVTQILNNGVDILAKNHVPQISMKTHGVTNACVCAD